MAVTPQTDSPDKNQGGRVLRTREKQPDSVDTKKEKRKVDTHLKVPDDQPPKSSLTLRSGNKSTKQAQIVVETDPVNK